MASWNERELEDWLWEHPEALESPNLRWLGRQVPLPSGQVVDLLGVREHAERPPEIIVAELKAVIATGDALSQLLSYLHVFRMAAYDRAKDFLPMYVDSARDICDRENPAVGCLDPYGYLIAPEFTPRVLLSAGSVPVSCKFVHQTFSFGDVSYSWMEKKTRADWPDSFTNALLDALSNTE